ncbi:MAG: hypothetical protein KatS3mg129_0205 [Leptospiraceae bacterium]|nr:MAG: hypothetical protein KatS3mg129_0205 [Leptospiraceae bacterium]
MFKKNLFILLLFCGYLYPQQFDEVIRIDDNFESLNFYSYVYYLELEKELNLEDILQHKLILLKKEMPFYEHFYKGYTKQIYWFRFKIKNESDNIININYLCCHYNTDYAILYVFKNHKLKKIIKMGDRFPIEQWIYPSKEIIFPLLLEPNTEYTFYLNIKTTSKTEIYFKLLNYSQLKKTLSNDYLILGFFLGLIFLILFMMILLNIYLKSEIILNLIFFIFFYNFGLISILGLGWEYLWGFFPYWNDRAHLIFMNMALIFSYKFMLLLYREFKYIKIFRNIFGILTLLNILIIFASFFDFVSYLNIATFILVIIVVPISFYLSLIVLKYKILKEKEIVYGWGILIFAALLYVIKQMNLFTDKYLFFINEKFFLFTSSIFFIFLVLGILKQFSFFRIKTIEYDLQLKIAENIQKKLIPDINKYNNIYLFYIPYSKVSGDFIYFKKFKDFYYIILSDIQGHGIGSSIVAGILKIILDFNKNWKESNSILEYIYKNLKNYLKEMFITLTMVKINIKNGSLEMYRCGGEYPVIIDKYNNKIFLTSEGTILHSSFFLFPEKKIYKLNNHDLILLFTDGLNNLFVNANVDLNQFFDFIYELFEKEYNKEIIHEKVQNYLDQYLKYQDDDISIIIYRR